MTSPVQALSVHAAAPAKSEEEKKEEEKVSAAASVVFGGAESAFMPPKVKRLRKLDDVDAGTFSSAVAAAVAGGSSASSGASAAVAVPKFSGIVFKVIDPADLLTQLKTDLQKIAKLAAAAPLFAKMQKNTHKALIEHLTHTKDPLLATQAELESELAVKAATVPIEKSFTHVTAKGARAELEDYFERKDSANFSLIVLMDGHGGTQVAEFAGKALMESMLFLEENVDNFKTAIEIVFANIQKHIQSNLRWQRMGSTAVLCFIQKATGLVYTATLGDSEANIYRTIGEEIKSIPLSCVRNWHSSKDSMRYADFYTAQALDHAISKGASAASLESYQKEKKEKILAKIQAMPSKMVRTKQVGLNVSRSFGDDSPQDHGLVSQKPKVSVFQLKEGDTLIIACDGLKDYVTESKVIEQIKVKGAANNLPRRLLDCVPGKAVGAPDNVTIACLEF